MALYIIEGPRGSGKTTIVSRLLSAYGDRCTVIKFNRTADPPRFMTEFLAKHYLALIDSRSICILDRFHLTEFVMRSLDKKVSKEILYETTHMIDTMLQYCGAITYVLEAPPIARKHRISKRIGNASIPEWGSYEEIDAAWKMAISTFRRSRVKVMKNVEPTDLDKIVFDIMKEHRSTTTLHDKIPFLPPFIPEDSMLTAETVEAK